MELVKCLINDLKINFHTFFLPKFCCCCFFMHLFYKILGGRQAVQACTVCKCHSARKVGLQNLGQLLCMLI